jgi:hypothetical protein
MHRFRSTSIGGLAGVAVAAGLFFYNIAHLVVRWDLVAIVATAAVVKMSVLAWYHRND